MITQIQSQDYTSFTSISVHCDKEDAAKIIAFIAQLNVENNQVKSIT